MGGEVGHRDGGLSGGPAACVAEGPRTSASTTTEPAGGAAERATVAPFQEKTAKGQPPETSRRSPSWSSAPKISALPETSCYRWFVFF